MAVTIPNGVARAGWDGSAWRGASPLPLEGEALVAGGRAAGGELEGGEAAGDGADPGHGGFGYYYGGGVFFIKTDTHNAAGSGARATVKRIEQMRAQGSQCKAREDEERRYSLIRGEIASPQVLSRVC